MTSFSNRRSQTVIVQPCKHKKNKNTQVERRSEQLPFAVLFCLSGPPSSGTRQLEPAELTEEKSVHISIYLSLSIYLSIYPHTCRSRVLVFGSFTAPSSSQTCLLLNGHRSTIMGPGPYLLTIFLDNGSKRPALPPVVS
jgi:hypothetical protein